MKNHTYYFGIKLLPVILLLLIHSCSGQEVKQTNPPVHRGDISQYGDKQPSVAGKFYPGDKNELTKTVAQLFSSAKPKTAENVLAIISPHAGYVFSGDVAATAFNQIDTSKNYKDIFIIGSSHYASYPSASIWSSGNYVTPSGIISVDTALGNKLIRENMVFTFTPEPYMPEHCLEVMLPLLQYKLKKPFRIVPVLIGNPSSDLCKNIAAALKKYLTPENLFIISTDCSHYPTFSGANYNDHRTAQAIGGNSVPYLEKMIENNEQKKIPGLSTSLCGHSSVMTLLYMTEKNEDIEILPLQYKNSGQTPYGDTNRVVGYYAFAIHQRPRSENDFFISTDEKTRLLQIARQAITEYIMKGTIPPLDTFALSRTLRTPEGAFVTLHEHGMLRGCIGHFADDLPLWKTVQQMAVAAATQDYRFKPVSSSELDKMDIEISVLSPLKKISSIDEIIMGKHGILIKKGMQSGTFLPQVAIDTGWDREEFLSKCSGEKAGFGPNGWKNAEIFIYEAKVFGEGE